MKVFRKPQGMRSWCEARRKEGKKIALVPTMGCLHEGHLSLVAAAKRKGADEIVVSIFVNPVQFGPNEDYSTYPRTEAADLVKCRAAGVTAVFAPSPDVMYALDRSVWVEEDGALSGSLCGARRPGHFRGVCTVVAKLFNIVRPDLAVFGQKDFQQAAIIKRMVRDLDFGIDIVTAPICREPSGLARSSRNTYLTEDERSRATALWRALETARAMVGAKGRMPWNVVRRRMAGIIERSGLEIDYVEAVDRDSLKPVKTLVRGVAVLVAAKCGKTRLIDNAIM